MIAEVSTNFDSAPSAQRGPVDELAFKEQSQLASQAVEFLRILPRRYRLALACHFGFDRELRTLSQLARQEGVSRQATSRWRERGLTLLRKKFQYEGGRL